MRDLTQGLLAFGREKRAVRISRRAEQSVEGRPVRQSERPGEAMGSPAPDPELPAKLQKYAEQQSREEGGRPVKQHVLIGHAQRAWGLSYRVSRDLARSLPKHLIYPARRRS
jgi:hypothetical protein